MDESLLSQITDALSDLPGVEALLLAGSRTAGTVDAHSDTDLYVYCDGEVDADSRRQVASRFCSRMEIDNRFWETEDLWLLNDEQGKVELIFRDYGFLRGELERILVRREAWVGFSTCIASNFFSSEILYDRDGRYAALREEFPDEYPEELAGNIIAKNFPILSDSLSSFRGQIEVAVSRGDLISVNHRVAAFLASYFDILFALNRMWHPGEKKLAAIVRDRGIHAPSGFSGYLDKLLFSSGTADSQLPMIVNLMTSHLKHLIVDTGFGSAIPGGPDGGPHDAADGEEGELDDDGGTGPRSGAGETE
jgi:hypothetical protein